MIKSLNRIIKDKNNRYHDYLIIFFIISIYLILFSLLFVLLGNKHFNIWNDTLYQYKLFYREWISKITTFIKTGKFNQYSFDMFLGTDFYSGMGYYCTGDLFLPILLIFRNNLDIGLLIETIMCIYLSSFFMKMFLDKLSVKNRKVSIFIALIYALAGQSIIYVQNFMFHRFFAFMPLLFFGVLQYFDNKKKTIFILAITILFLQNYYFMFPTLIFLLFYCVVECINRKYSIKEIIKDFFILLACIVEGFFISAFISLPSMLYIVGNAYNRTSGISLRMWENNTKFGLLFSLISLNPVCAPGISNIFSNTSDYHEMLFNLFITIIPLIFCIKSINKKNIPSSILLIVLWIIAEIKPLNSIMHGFSIPSLRWIFVLEFYMLSLAAKEMDNYVSSKEDKKKLNIIVLIIYLILGISFGILYITNYINFESQKDHIIYLLISLIVSILIFVLYKKNEKWGIGFTLTFVFVSTLLYYSDMNTNHNYELVISKDEVVYNEQLLHENENYRHFFSYLDSYDHMPLDSNASLVADIYTTSTYSSAIDPNIRKFIDIGNSIESVDWNVEISDKNLLTMLGTKYLILGNESKEYFGINGDNYSLAYTLNTFDPYEVYKNNNFIGFGYSAPNIKYLKDYSGNTKEFIDYVLIDDDNFDFSSIKPTYKELNIEKMGEDKLIANISLDSNNILFIPLPNNKGWTVKVNDNIVKPISVNGGFIGLVLDKGYNNIDMTFHSPYLKEGIILSCIGILIFIFINRKERKA